MHCESGTAWAGHNLLVSRWAFNFFFAFKPFYVLLKFFCQQQTNKKFNEKLIKAIPFFFCVCILCFHPWPVYLVVRLSIRFDHVGCSGRVWIEWHRLFASNNCRHKMDGCAALKVINTRSFFLHSPQHLTLSPPDLISFEIIVLFFFLL